eukprot:GHVU01057683.1.p1 GENE.GHVU01057683.1~~GHVU01057683.1.p1  ORF type:complete len:158 (-),score=2.93 GHVU01057683.1:90-563(-)
MDKPVPPPKSSRPGRTKLSKIAKGENPTNKTLIGLNPLMQKTPKNPFPTQSKLLTANSKCTLSTQPLSQYDRSVRLTSMKYRTLERMNSLLSEETMIHTDSYGPQKSPHTLQVESTTLLLGLEHGQTKLHKYSKPPGAATLRRHILYTTDQRPKRVS